jgi:HTH-type transcriptional regulator/antitoxin HipB
MKPNETGFILQTPMQFGIYLRSLRRTRGLTQRELGLRIGVTGARISEIENDSGGVGLTQILKILHILKARVVIQIQDEKPAHHLRKHTMPAGEW